MYDHFLFRGNRLFSLENVPDEHTFYSEYDDEKYAVSISWVDEIEPNSREALVFYKVFFNLLLRKLRFQEIGRKHFDGSPAAAIKFPSHKLELWPGYASTIEHYQAGVLLNLDVAHKVLRDETAFHVIEQVKEATRRGVRQRGAPDLKEEVLRALVGLTVMTPYNKRTYAITDVDFEGTINDEFELADGSRLSYANYFRNKYGVLVREQGQPLLVHTSRRTG